MTTRLELDRAFVQLEKRLPPSIARMLRWLREPGSRYVRIPAALVLMAGGFVGFLPVLGFWMIPVALLLLAVDLPFLRPPLLSLINWAERKWSGAKDTARPNRDKPS